MKAVSGLSRTITTVTALAALTLSAIGVSGASAEEDTSPRAPAGFDQKKDVPHGKVTHESYDSKTLGFERKMNVYTPPGFNKDDKEKKYPVLYLLHGAGDDETGWVQKGAADNILDNLIAEKKAEPMIVVMPYGYAAKPGTPRPGRDTPPEERRKMNAQFEQDLLQDVIPYVDAHYPTIPDRDHRALAGLSMGGGQTSRIGPPHSDTFAYLGVFSAGLGGPAAQNVLASYPEADVLNSRLKLFWVSCGDRDPGLEGAKNLDHTLTEKKIQHVWHQDTGAHEWPVWRNDLYLVAQRLFKGK